MNWKDCGWNERFAALAAEEPLKLPGRVTAQEKGLCRVITEAGELLAEPSGKFRFQAQSGADYPAAGDFVLLEPGAAPQQRAVFHRVLPRKSCFVRKAAGTARQEQVVAANVDTVFLCMSLNRDFNLRRLERYLTLAWDSGASPVVVLTKADLCGELPARLQEAESAAAGAQVLAVSALEQDGAAALQPWLRPGQTVAFLGSSGVGKSTLINCLLGRQRQETGGLGWADKGRHTTTRRELILLPRGGLVLDTPGMRELGLWDAGQGVERTFEELEALAGGCRFGDCTHTSEPGCALQAALRQGTLDPERFASWQKLRAESAEDRRAAKERKFKQIAKFNRTNPKR